MTDSVQLTSVHLRVSDLARSLAFYTGQLGFVVRERSSATAADSSPHAQLATAPDAPALLELTEDRSAVAAPSDAAGLFHAALLFPSRAALGRWLAHAAERHVEFDGFSDHGVSEAIYFTDPDGNGLEFYVDRPRAQWPFRNGELAMMTAPLNVRDLLSAGSPAAPVSSGASPSTRPPVLAGARWGHLHLRVSDLDRAEEFYSGALHLSLMQRFGANARFLAADGYHHHLGLNNWGGVRRAQPAGALGLVATTFSAATTSAPESQRDPDGLTLRLQPLTTATTAPAGKNVPP